MFRVYGVMSFNDTEHNNTAMANSTSETVLATEDTAFMRPTKMNISIFEEQGPNGTVQHKEEFLNQTELSNKTSEEGERFLQSYDADENVTFTNTSTGVESDGKQLSIRNETTIPNGLQPSTAHTEINETLPDGQEKKTEEYRSRKLGKKCGKTCCGCEQSAAAIPVVAAVPVVTAGYASTSKY